MLNQLAKECYENAKAHGFWDASSNVGEKFALMHSEVSEAFEEYRSGHAPNEVYHPTIKTGAPGIHKPEGIPIELADCVIRILDYCGRFDIDLEYWIEYSHKDIAHFHWEKLDNIGEWISYMHSELTNGFNWHMLMLRTTYAEYNPASEFIKIALARTTICIQDFCNKYEIDLEAAIKEKMEYNKTRPFMHNKVV